MERLLEEISFEGSESCSNDNGIVAIDAEYVNAHLTDLADDEDLSRYIL